MKEQTKSDLSVAIGAIIAVIAMLGFIWGMFASFKTDIMTEVREVKADVRILKTDVGTLKTDVAALKKDVGILKTDVKSINRRLYKLEKKMDDFSSFKKRIKQAAR